MVATRTFPYHRFSGTHRDIGRQYGEACRDLIILHRDKALERLERVNRISASGVRSAAGEYRDAVLKFAPFFDEEVTGLAEGAGLELSDAWLLQLRAELGVTTPADLDDDGSECTTFAVLPEATSNGIGLVGQNADLPAFYRDIAVVFELEPDDQPNVLMMTPAGQLSYTGINDQGLGVFANFITCDGWQTQFPRYFLSRLALTYDNAEDAINAVGAVERASSRNIIMLDGQGTAVDIETTPRGIGRLDPVDGLLVHTNHFVAPEMASEERAKPRQLENSKRRYERMTELLRANYGELDVERMATLLRNRDAVPDAVCRAHGDEESDIMTFGSAIAEPSMQRMWVAAGPPHEHPYQCYEFGAGGPDPARQIPAMSTAQV